MLKQNIHNSHATITTSNGRDVSVGPRFARGEMTIRLDVREDGQISAHPLTIQQTIENDGYDIVVRIFDGDVLVHTRRTHR